MRFLQGLISLVILVAMFGCGGGGGTGSGIRGEVTGLILDFNGDAVRGATVWIDGSGETVSNSAGTFLLENVSPGDRRVRAEIVQDGLTYRGENMVRVFEGERSKSVQVTVMRPNQMARVYGVVIDNQGFNLEGARVHAIPTTVGGVFGSSLELTNSNGRFDFDSLMGGVEYRIIASGVGYNSDADVITVPAGGEQELVLTLKNPTDPLLPAPTGLDAVTWTTPSEITRSPQSEGAYQNIKRLFDPRTPSKTITRNTVDGNWIEADLFWDPYPDNAAHIGFGIYRRTGTSGPFTAIDFLRDTEAESFIDMDEDLIEFQTYQYYISSVNTSDPSNNSESDPSNTAQVQTLGDLYPLSPLQGPLRFRWESGSGAEEYVVYLFDEYPGIGVDPIWTSAPVAGTQVTYNGGGLQSGQRYYYVVVGSANSNSSRTISRVENFVAN